MEPLERHLFALDLLEAGLTSTTVDELEARMAPDVERMSRDELAAVVVALTAEATMLLPVMLRPRLVRWLSLRRLSVEISRVGE